MKVFISYSVKGLRLVELVSRQIQPHAKAVYWSRDRMPGQDAWATIFRWIDASDCVIAVLTGNVLERGESVHQEVGYAKGKGKVVIPLVGSSVPRDRLGCLHGITYLPLDRERFPEAMDRLKATLGAMAKQKQRQAWATLGLVAFVGLALSSHQADGDEWEDVDE
jgi:hypothetical protein